MITVEEFATKYIAGGNFCEGFADLPSRWGYTTTDAEGKYYDILYYFS
jgi:hypothetical protein